MKKIKFATTTMAILLLFFVIYNTIFGWNQIAISEAEKTCDYIFKVGMSIAWAFYFLPLFDIYEDFVEKRESNKED